MPAKGYDFAKTLCHFHRDKDQVKVNNLDFFQMISQIDLQDIKNQYVDNLDKTNDF